MLAQARNRANLPLHPGALSHYVDVAAYQRRYATRAEDVAYYVRLSRKAGGEVLEYGCGNGRVTLALARAGVHVTGVDASRFMLEDLRCSPPVALSLFLLLHAGQRAHHLA